jgi:hypothetical protein
VVVALGETAWDPETPDGEKPLPVPLQEVALVFVQASVDDLLFGIEAGDADNATVGRARLTACPVINTGETSKTSLIVANTVIGNINLLMVNET